MGKRRILTELEKIEARLKIPPVNLSEFVFYADITMALGVDMQRLVEKAADLRQKLTEQIVERSNETRPT